VIVAHTTTQNERSLASLAHSSHDYGMPAPLLPPLATPSLVRVVQIRICSCLTLLVAVRGWLCASVKKSSFAFVRAREEPATLRQQLCQHTNAHTHAHMHTVTVSAWPACGHSVVVAQCRGGGLMLRVAFTRTWFICVCARKRAESNTSPTVEPTRKRAHTNGLCLASM
jgi:hypothetical protein